MIRAHRSWVLASRPEFCVVCGGRARVVLWPPGAPELAWQAPCPHCRRHIPIRTVDHPRTAS